MSTKSEKRLSDFTVKYWTGKAWLGGVVSLFFDTQLTPTDGAAILEEVRAMPGVRSAILGYPSNHITVFFLMNDVGCLLTAQQLIGDSPRRGAI